MENGGILIIIIAVIFILYKTFKTPASPTKKGKKGESRVANILYSLPADKYQVVNDVIIQNQQSTSQIDHIVVSPYGIFVIETKNYSGYVSGSENSENWKESFKTAGKNYFRNPIKQNWGHIYALSEYLNCEKRLFKPIIVFSDEARLFVNATKTPVINMFQLKNVILNYQQEIIPPEDVVPIAEKIRNAKPVDDIEIGDKHTQSVREIIAKKDEAIRQGKCPKCGGDLVFRNGKYGGFYGCSNYPKCRYTHNADW